MVKTFKLNAKENDLRIIAKQELQNKIRSKKMRLEID
jgi:hypothetical protein